MISGGSQPSHADKFSSIPIHIGGLSNIKELATGVNHLLALSHDGAVYSCGSGHQAELGRRVLSRRPYAALEPRVIFSSRHLIKRIFAGFNHSFAIDSQERVYSWGLNNFGQTGHGIDSYNSHVVSPAIVDSLGGLGIRELAPGFHHTLACTEDGTLLAWGRCDDSQLGVSLDEISTADIVLSSSGRPCAVSVPTKVPGEFYKHVLTSTYTSRHRCHRLCSRWDRQLSCRGPQWKGLLMGVFRRLQDRAWNGGFGQNTDSAPQ